jgi:glyoxylase-like metal-dependent hydrolase (beta-lactamase superfamily II)
MPQDFPRPPPIVSRGDESPETEKEANQPLEENLSRVPSVLALGALLGLCLESAQSFGQANSGIGLPFGDGRVTMIATPGHTPGHQSLVRLSKAGALLLSGDTARFKDNWDNRRVPENNNDKNKSAASMQRMADLMTKEKARHWINHDTAQRDSLRMAPAFYD